MDETTLTAMRADLETMTKRLADIAAENKPGLADEQIRKLDEEHAELTRKATELRDKIEAAEYRDNRIVMIRSLAAQADMRRFGEQHVLSGTDIEAFRGLLAAELANQSDDNNIRSMTGISLGRSNFDQLAAAVTNALLHRASPAAVELTAEGRNFRGMPLLGIAKDVLEANGVSTRGMSRQDLAAAALQQRGGGLHTTTDFPGILANITNTTLRAAYQAAPQTFRPLVRETTAVDFKPITRAQFGEAPALEKVNEHGEFKRGTIAEGKESYKIATYGKIVAITRQVLINDDLDAFARLPSAFGTQAAQLESDLVWGQILSNPLMGDGVALFHASHKNLMVARAIDIDPVSEGRTLFALQTGLDGKTIIGLAPAYLIVPVAMQTRAEQFLGQISPAKTADVVPTSLQRLSIIAEPRLDKGIDRPDDNIVVEGSATAWYMAGLPAQTDIIELAYLEGARGVYTETRTGFDIDGIETNVRLDVAAKILDWRNIAKNPGA
ncbi:hypothetical protein ATY77_26655 [Rhizobium sp. R634]|uniref:phage major capsid protein n=1 Tax=Rhizobium sp. R634 TaxID=1764274 RepID=UPI000B537194|nr:hypothetical protein [Rhizobium sp. R634]OWV79571.1 hypothetical protein ATY77_26655 [Rhizobium sp. R634]